MLPQFDRLKLLLAGSLLLGGAAGCSASRNSQATATNRPQETRYGATPKRILPPVADTDGGSAEEYPDFRGPREPGHIPGEPGRSFIRSAPEAPTAGPGPELSEPPEFPSADDMTHRTSRPFLPSLKSKTSSAPRQTSSASASRRATLASQNTPAADPAWGTEQYSGMVVLELPPELAAASARKSGAAPQRQTLPLARGSASGPALAAASRPREWSGTPVAATEEVPQWAPARTLATRQVSNPETPSASKTTALEVSSTVAKSEAVRVIDPPRLSTTPTDGDIDAPGSTTADELAISRMLLCREVRGFGDVDELQTAYLRQGQPILIYTALDSFLSVATAKGYRTLTSSVLEIQTRSGEVVLRMPLGTAIDQTESPRQDFFLTHKLTIPENLPVGDYVFDLRVEDLQSHETARARMDVAVRGDRTRPGGTGDTSIFATRPDSFRR